MTAIDLTIKVWDYIPWNRWYVCIGGVLIQLALGTIYCWNVVSLFVSKPGFVDFEMKDTVFIFAAGLLSFGFTMILSGRLQQRYGPQVVSMASAIIVGLSIALSGLVANFYYLLVTYGLLFGAGIALGYVCPIAILPKWFPDKKGLVTGIAVAGFGAGAFVGNFIIKFFANPDNLDTASRDEWSEAKNDIFKKAMEKNVPIMFLVSGIIYFILILLGSITMRVPPSDYVPEGWTPPEKKGGKKVRDIETKEAVRTTTLWYIWGLFIASAISGLLVIGVYGSFGSHSLNTNDSFVALLGGIAALCNGLGRIFWGKMCDAVGSKYAMSIMFGVQSILMFVYGVSAFHESFYFIITCILLFCFGGNFSMFPTAVGEIFGIKNLGPNYGIVFTAYGIAGAFGALVVKIIMETLEKYLAKGTCFMIIFIICACLSLVATFATLKIPPLKQEEELKEVKSEEE